MPEAIYFVDRICLEKSNYIAHLSTKMVLFCFAYFLIAYKFSQIATVVVIKTIAVTDWQRRFKNRVNFAWSLIICLCAAYIFPLKILIGKVQPHFENASVRRYRELVVH